MRAARRRRAGLAALLGALVVGGCGKDSGLGTEEDAQAGSDAAPAVTAAPAPPDAPDAPEAGGTRTAEEPGAPPAADAEALRRVALKYLRGLRDEDYTVVCQTRTPEERRRFARQAGSCPAAFAAIAASARGQDLQRLGRAAVIEVETQGRTATVGLGDPGSTEVEVRLKARLGRTGRWLLVSG